MAGADHSMEKRAGNVATFLLATSNQEQHVPKEIRKIYSKLVSKVKFMGSLLRIFMPHFQCVGS